VNAIKPFLPTVSLIRVASSSRRQRFKTVVLVILAAQAVFLLGLLATDHSGDLLAYAQELPDSFTPSPLPSTRAMTTGSDARPASLPRTNSATLASTAQAPKPATPVAKFAPHPNPSRPETLYTVQSGDTLADIARRYATTPNAIKTANALTTDHLRVSQKLKIP
jgi:LysM repeat protein